jgi:hypothetical protein
MRKILLSFVGIVIAMNVFAQVPSVFKYQALVRGANNATLDNQAVGMQLSIKQGSIGGIIVYSETFATTTSSYGSVNLEIGKGVSAYQFTSIDWANGPYFIETAVDIAGGTMYRVMGTSQLISVPYALHAETAEYVTNDAVIDADANPINEIQTLVKSGSSVSLSNGGGTFKDSIGDYTSGSGIFISNNVISQRGQCPLAIGDAFEGGVVFYLDPTNCSGLICAPTDQSAAAKWDDGSNYSTAAFASCVGCGYGNTAAILNIQGTSTDAASKCAALNIGGYDDWYLPSSYELHLMYSNVGQGNVLGLGNIGGFSNSYYWSSTEGDNYHAWVEDFRNAYRSDASKFYLNNVHVRAIRFFYLILE